MSTASRILVALGVIVGLAVATSAHAGLAEWDGRGAPMSKVAQPVLDAAALKALSGRKRLALLIGNGSGYVSDATIAKPEQDVSSMAALLRGMGFTVYGKVNAGKEEMERLVDDFATEAARFDKPEVVFYYSGHGQQVGGVNYLIPVDMPSGGDEIAVRNRAVSLNYAMQRLETLKGPRVVILDACRNNPFVKSYKSAPVSGLAKVDTGNNSLIAFATQSGAVAQVGGQDYPHSVFTEFFLKAAMADPKRPIDGVLQSARTMVIDATNRAQQPEYTYNLDSTFSLVPRTCPILDERQLWDAADRAGSVEAFNTFIARCPDGDRVADARRTIDRIRRTEELEVQVRTASARPAIPSPPLTAVIPPQQVASVMPPPAVSEAEIGAPSGVIMLKGRWKEPGSEFKDCADCPEMVVVPPGSFMMGSPASEKDRYGNEGPQHRVTIPRPFSVGKYTVTQSEWEAVMGNNPSKFKGPRNPVENVSWKDISMDYLPRLNAKIVQSVQVSAGAPGPYRLLTEAEWEYAARAGTTSRYWWGDEIGQGNANCNGCGSQWDNKTTAPVGSFRPNLWGLYDIHGNVWQWVEDCYAPDYRQAPQDGAATKGPDSCDRVHRSGYMMISPSFLRSATREGRTPDYRTASLGFRLARTLP